MTTDILAAMLLLAGSTLALAAAIGLHRLPDLYARMHAATKPASLGYALCVTAAILSVDNIDARTKLGLAILLQFLTAPTAAHLLARAAHGKRVELSEYTVVDELGHRDNGAHEE